MLLSNYYMPFQKIHLETDRWEETCSNCISQVCQTREHHIRVRRLSTHFQGLFEWDLLLHFRLPLPSNWGLPFMLEFGFCKWLFLKDLCILCFLDASSGKQPHTCCLVSRSIIANLCCSWLHKVCRMKGMCCWKTFVFQHSSFHLEVMMLM